VAVRARTSVLGVEELWRSDWSLPCVQFLPVPLFLSGSAVAEPANSTQLAETAAYLLGNAHRCGVADERVEHAETAIRDLIIAAARDSSEAATAESRFFEIFSVIATRNQDRDGFPSCKVVIARFERLEGHHHQADY
jgi:hypothetical protein